MIQFMPANHSITNVLSHNLNGKITRAVQDHGIHSGHAQQMCEIIPKSNMAKQGLCYICIVKLTLKI